MSAGMFFWERPISRTGMLGSITMQILNDCHNAATVCNTGAEINMQVKNSLFLCVWLLLWYAASSLSPLPAGEDGALLYSFCIIIKSPRALQVNGALVSMTTFPKQLYFLLNKKREKTVSQTAFEMNVSV